jgi:cytochrome c-type biogenesis protein CcmE
MSFRQRYGHSYDCANGQTGLGPVVQYRPGTRRYPDEGVISLMSIRVKLIVALVFVVGVLGVLIRTAVTHAASYYLTVDELYAQGKQAVGQETTVSGDIVADTVDWRPEKSLLTFTIKDPHSGRRLPVVFHGAKPDDFANDWPVIVTGRLEANGQFRAEKLLIKCPSKYEAKQQTFTATS